MTTNSAPGNPQALPSQTPPFLTKLYQLVSDPTTQALVSWTDEKGLSFTVHKPSEFGRDILPRYFKHNNFSSFVRQLNQYGFHKQNPDKWMFGHDSFRRDSPDLLKNITRRRPKQSQSANAVLPAAITQNAVVELGNYGLEGELKSLKRDKDLLIKELVVTRQKEEQLKNRCENLETRVANLENSSKQMQAFIMHYFSQVLQPYSEAMASRKRKRLPSSSVEEPDTMIVEQPSNQVANIPHTTGHSSVDALRVMMQQMGVGITRSPTQTQAQSPAHSHAQPRISFEPATVQELPLEESSSTISPSMRIMPPNSNNTLTLISPPVLTASASQSLPIAVAPSISPPSTASAPLNPTTQSTPHEHMLSTQGLSASPSSPPASASAVPKEISTNSKTLSNDSSNPLKTLPTTTVKTVKTASRPFPSSRSNGSARRVRAPRTSAAKTLANSAANGTRDDTLGIVSLPAFSVLPTSFGATGSSPPARPNHVASTAIPATSPTMPNGTGNGVDESPFLQWPAASTQLATRRTTGVTSSHAHAGAHQEAHVQSLLGNRANSSTAAANALLDTPEPSHTPDLGAASIDARMANGVIDPNIEAETLVSSGDARMTDSEEICVASPTQARQEGDPDVDRALEFLEDIPSTPNTSMTMDAIENALQEPRSRSRGTHLDTPDFDKAFDDKEFNISFGNEPNSVKLNGHCPSAAENERVIEDFLELSADDSGLPPPLAHLPEGTDIHALAKKIESFADP